jgi:hypothetical protein
MGLPLGGLQVLAPVGFKALSAPNTPH